MTLTTAEISSPGMTLNMGPQHPSTHGVLRLVVELVRDSSMDAIVLLAHERVHDPDGTARDDLGSMFVPNDVVLGLAKKFPEFLAGVSIHPARRDGFDELERCLAGGAVLMKCLPNCQNIDPSDRRYRPFWERMAAAGLENGRPTVFLES